MSANQVCPFKLLGLIHSTATLETVAKAHRRLVLVAHPDKNPGDPNASRRTQILNDAKDRANALLQPETYTQKRSREQQEEAKAQQEDDLKAAEIKRQKDAEAAKIKRQKDAEAAEVSRRLKAEAATVWASLARKYGYDPFCEDFIEIRRLAEAELWKAFNCGTDDLKAEWVKKNTGGAEYELRHAIIAHKARKEQEAQAARERETRKLREQELKQREVQAAQELRRREQDLEAKRLREMHAARERELEAQRLRDVESAREREQENQRLREQELKQREVQAAQELLRREQDLEAKRLRGMQAALLQKQCEQEVATQRLHDIEAARECELEAQRLRDVESAREREQENQRLREQELKQREVQAAQELLRREQDLEARRLRGMQAALLQKQCEQEVATQRLHDIEAARACELEAQRLRDIESARELEAHVLLETQEHEREARERDIQAAHQRKAQRQRQFSQSNANEPKVTRKHIRTRSIDEFYDNGVAMIDNFIDTRIQLAPEPRLGYFVARSALVEAFFGTQNQEQEEAIPAAKICFFHVNFKARMAIKHIAGWETGWKRNQKPMRGYKGIILL